MSFFKRTAPPPPPDPSELEIFEDKDGKKYEGQYINFDGKKITLRDATGKYIYIGERSLTKEQIIQAWDRQKKKREEDAAKKQP